MTLLADVCAELATLTPCLPAALTRDNTPGQPGGHLTAGNLVNPDVLHAILTLHHEIPHAYKTASETCGEPGAYRDLPTCLRALPRLAQRLTALGHPDATHQLEQAATWWLRVTKTALGLRTPDLHLGVTCPATGCGQAELLAAGSEGFLRRHDNVFTVEWEHAGRIYCPACGAAWGVSEWAHLGRVLQATP